MELRVVLLLASLLAGTKAHSKETNKLAPVNFVVLSNRRRIPPIITSASERLTYESNVYYLTMESRCSTSFRLTQPAETTIEKLSHLVHDMVHPFIIRDGSQGIVNWSGSNVDLFRTIADSVGFKYVLREPVDRTLGILRNVSDNGLLEMAFKNEIDITLFICVYQSQPYFDMIWPSYYGHWAIVIPAPAVTYDLLSNVKPFRLDVWLCIVGSLLSVSLAMWAVSRCFTPRSDLVLDFLYNIALITGQGGFSPKYLTGKFLAAAWNLGAFIIVFCYTSILISFVTARIPEARLSSLEDFVTKGTLKPAAHDQHIFLTYFLDATSGLAKQIGDVFRNEPKSVVYSNDEGIKLVLGGRHAFITGVPMAEIAIIEDFKSVRKCRMTMVLGNGVGYSLVGWFTSKLVPSLTRALHERILNAHEAGLISYYGNRYVPRIACLGMRNVAEAPQDSPILLVQLQTSFLILGLGVVAALIAFVHEHLKYNGYLLSNK